MTKIHKKILFLFFSFIFIVGLYFGLLLTNLIAFYQNIKKQKYSLASGSLSNISYLTDWSNYICDNCLISSLNNISNSSTILLDYSIIIQNTLQAVVKNEPEKFKTYYPQLKNNLPNLIENLALAQKTLKTIKPKILSDKIQKNQKIIFFNQLSDELIINKDKVSEFIDLLPQILAYNSEKKYIVLLQNNMELRPSGGFIGSYAELYFKNGALQKLDLQDIYVPDGQVKGFINPPGPIQEAFKMGNWRLRDANWDPDFPISAQSVSWFLKEGGVDSGSGVIALNLTLFENILSIIGEISLPDYKTKVRAENLYEITQYEAERDFFPGSTQKKDFLFSLAKNVQLSTEKISFNQILEITKIILNHLAANDIQFYFTDETLENFIDKNNWSGKIKWDKNPDLNNDYFYLVEANLGANKANCCIQREVKRKIIDKLDYYEVITEIIYKNNSPVANPKPPKYWGGNYKNYLRILIPSSAALEKVKIGNDILSLESLDIVQRNEIKEYGFFVTILSLEEKKVEFNYLLPKDKNSTYQLFIQKQSGINPHFYTIDLIEADSQKQTKRFLDKNSTINF